ncbi:hypothetical protein MMC11_002033 [Xylographa trunciseda]|nr:hypothetical protein [Xylographa trunciseda]
MQAQAKAVFAHFIVGNAYGFTTETYAKDMALASAAGIDGFAMNIAGDSWTGDQLNFAYEAAASLGNFSLFLSFDHAANDGAFGGSFTAANIASYINTYKIQKAQYFYNGAPVASTFEGPAHAADWINVKAATGCFFIPDWTSRKGAALYDGEASLFDNANVDGALSWDVWPNGPTGISTMIDTDWRKILGDKVYMMGVSPWFYTNLPAYGKNWLWRGDNLWHDRWEQVLEIQPEIVEILTWNDYGESHYIGPLHASNNFPPGSEQYAAANPHDAWRDLLPYYIAAYKSGNSSSIPVTEEKIIWAHKINPANSGSASGTVGNNANDNDQTIYPPGQLNLDAINLDVIVQEPSQVTVQIGNNPPSVLQANVAGPNHFLVYWNGQTGTVTYTVSRNGQTVLSTTGATITSDCVNGIVNWNAVVGSS